MSENNPLAVLDKMSADVNVGIDEVVNVFVSQHEGELHSEKKRLSKEMKEVKSSLANLEKNLISEVNKEHKKYEFENEVLNIKSYFDPEDTTISWDDKVGTIKIEIKDSKSKERYRSTIDKYFEVELDVEKVEERSKQQEVLAGLTSELSNIVAQIKDISRKERQIRGEISKRKLEASGYQELFNDDALKGLIQLEKLDED